MAPPSQTSLLTMTSAGQEEAAKVVVAVRCRPWTREKTADEQKLIVKLQNEDEGVPNGKVVVWRILQDACISSVLVFLPFWVGSPAVALKRVSLAGVTRKVPRRHCFRHMLPCRPPHGSKTKCYVSAGDLMRFNVNT
jgi:hypothetical protein